MQAEKDNNAANYEEIEGHVKVLSAKLSQMTQNNSGVQDAIESLEDYYERAVQLRIYRITTLEEELKEQDARHAERERLHRLGLLLLVLIFVLNSIIKHPKQAFSFFYYTWSYIVVAVVAAFVTRWRRSDERRPAYSSRQQVHRHAD